METIRLDELELDAVEQDTGARWLASFPFSPDQPGETTTDASDYTVVYNELCPGMEIGRHTDAVDELLVVLAGTVAATVDGETTTVEADSLAVVPAETPHSVRNVGADTARLLGVFCAAPLSSEFETEPSVTDDG